MLLLTGTSDLVRVVTDASADVEVHASWVDHSAGVFTPGRTNTASITTATTTTVVGSPAASTQRNVLHLNIRNNHASTSVLVTVFHTDGTTQEDLMKVTLRAGEALVLSQGGVWLHYTGNGVSYPSYGPAATQAQMEAATSFATYVTPGRQHFHPGHPKCWVECGTTGNVLASYNITSVTDAGVGLATVNIATDMSSADYACKITTERAITTLAVANLRMENIVSAGQAAGVLQMECYDYTATTAVQSDPATWQMFCCGDQA